MTEKKIQSILAFFTEDGWMDHVLLRINQQSLEKAMVPSGQTRRLVKVKGDIASLKLVKFPVIEKGEHNSHF